jgi:dTDP-glucose pyrophosphorylase/CBS domain-containing protein
MRNGQEGRQVAMDQELPLADAGCTLREAVRITSEATTSVCLLVDAERRLVGTLSDGDIRRAFLAEVGLDSAALPWASQRPSTVPIGTDRSAVLDLMQALGVPQIPEVDTEGRVVRLHLLRNIVGGQERKNTAVVLAGGRGTRLRPATGALPKPMVEVAGRPILERLVLHLVGSGISDVRLAVGYGADVIEQHFGDGERFGCRIGYLREQEPLGTAGPLRGLLQELPSSPVIVLNGDLVTSFSVTGLLAAHEATGARMTVAVTDYRHEVPYGVLDTAGNDGCVVGLVEKPAWTGTVNAGIYALDPLIIEEIPEGRSVPMTEMIERCLERRERVTAWRALGDWHDVGRPDDLARARGV